MEGRRIAEGKEMMEGAKDGRERDERAISPGKDVRETPGADEGFVGCAGHALKGGWRVGIGMLMFWLAINESGELGGEFGVLFL